MTPYYLNNRNLIIKKSRQSHGQNVHRISEQQSSEKMQSYPTRFKPVSSQQNVSKKGKPPMSIIIGVIVVAVILMIAVFIRVIFLPEDYVRRGPTPTVSMHWVENPEYRGQYSGYVVSISGVRSINIDDVIVRFSHGGYTGSAGLDHLAGGDIESVGAFTLGFSDLPPIGSLGAEDVFTITGGNPGDIITLLYEPTGGQMCSSTLH